MNIQHYNIVVKLRNAAKIVAGVIGGGGALLFIITLVAAGSYGGITFWVFLAAAIPCTIYILLAWLAYHLINIITDTFDNTEKILKKIDLLQSSAVDVKSTESTLASQYKSTVTEPTTAQSFVSTPVPAPVQVPITAQKLIVKPKPTFGYGANDEIVEVTAEDSKPLVITESDVIAPPEVVIGEYEPQSAEKITPITDALVSGVTFCRECGFSYDRDGNFCPQCGTKNDLKS
jgi:hypothetical protein